MKGGLPNDPCSTTGMSYWCVREVERVQWDDPRGERREDLGEDEALDNLSDEEAPRVADELTDFGDVVMEY